MTYVSVLAAADHKVLYVPKDAHVLIFVGYSAFISLNTPFWCSLGNGQLRVWYDWKAFTYYTSTAYTTLLNVNTACDSVLATADLKVLHGLPPIGNGIPLRLL